MNPSNAIRRIIGTGPGDENVGQNPTCMYARLECGHSQPLNEGRSEELGEYRCVCRRCRSKLEGIVP
jgi:hypothetical protein